MFALHLSKPPKETQLGTEARRLDDDPAIGRILNRCWIDLIELELQVSFRHVFPQAGRG